MYPGPAVMREVVLGEGEGYFPVDQSLKALNKRFSKSSFSSECSTRQFILRIDL